MVWDYKKKSMILILLVNLLVGCANIDEDGKKTNDTQNEERTEHRIDEMDTLQFTSFLDSFNSSEKFQIEHINFPLEVEITDDFDQENTGYTTFINKDDFEIIQISEPKCSFTTENVKMEFSHKKEIMEVILKGEETGFYMIFLFQKVKNEWSLSKVIDDSI